jgi:hypothetical protein
MSIPSAAQVEHRGPAAVLDRHEEWKQHRGEDEPPDHQRAAPAGNAAAGDPVDEPGQPDHEGEGAEQVEAADRVAAGQLAQDEGAPGGAGQGQRHVEPENPVPGDRYEGTAKHRPEHQADRRDHRVGSHRQPELLAREGVGHQGGPVGEDEGAADALEDAPGDQLGAAGREAGAQRGHPEDDEGADEGALAAEQVREPAGGEDQHCRGDHVGEDHPDELEQGRAERALQVGQGDDQRAGVGCHQQHPEAGAGERPPLVVGVVC